MRKYTGVIIEESLADKNILRDVKIVSTKIEKVTAKHKTPWLRQWTLHTIEVESKDVDGLAELLSKSFEREHPWYADFDNGVIHYIVYRGRIFRVTMRSREEYDRAKAYGIASGIPSHQVDFHPLVEKWKR